MKKEMMIGSLLLAVLMMAFSVSAFGASTPYWDENPLKLAPGESTVIEMTLQNMVGEEDMVFTAEISNNEGIAHLVDPEFTYAVPFGSEDVKVPIEVSVPVDMQQGGKREITVSFMQVSEGGDDMVSLSGGFTSNFVVEVVTEENSELFVPEAPFIEDEPVNLVWVWVLLILIIAGAIGYYFWKKK